jgi:hypothetical protein
MTMKYKVKLVIRTPDGIAIGDLETWFGKFCIEHHVYIEGFNADGKYVK